MENVEKLLQALFIGISLASVLLQTCRYGKAIELFTECLEFQNKHVKGQAIDYGNLGTIYQHFGDYKTAYELHRKALEIKTQIDFKEGMPADYLNLGHCCKHLGEYATAKEF